MKKIGSVDEIKQIQLDILLAFHEFCIDNSINYSLAYGTLLGAIRHKGFIPWDDDIDVCLLRADYEKLERLFPQYLKERYVFLSLSRDNKWNRPYGMIYDNYTIEVEDASNNYEGVGVGIDVFPIDDVSQDDHLFTVFQKKRIFLVYALNMKFLRWSANRSFFKNLLLAFSKVLLTPVPSRLIAKRIDYLSKNVLESSKVYHSSDTDIHLFESVPKSLFSGYIDVPFEGFSVKAMNGYDKYLSSIYGDYMTPPPSNQRGSTHSYEAYWK